MKFATPTLQIGFATRLDGVRQTVLRDALLATVGKLSIAQLDRELGEFVSETALASLAAHGLRGEILFPVPMVLSARPSLLGYYRLLYGYSQKSFYGSAMGCGRFKAMENAGRLSAAANQSLTELCLQFSVAGDELLAGIEGHLANRDLFHELSLLTLGGQFRGGVNNDRGSAGIKAIFERSAKSFAMPLSPTAKSRSCFAMRPAGLLPSMSPPIRTSSYGRRLMPVRAGRSWRSRSKPAKTNLTFIIGSARRRRAISKRAPLA